MFIRSGYSAQTRSTGCSGTQQHHLAADVVVGRGDVGAAGRMQPCGLPPRTRAPVPVRRSSRITFCSTDRGPDALIRSRRRSSRNPSGSARTAVGRLEYTTPSTSRMSGSGVRPPSTTSNRSSSGAIATASSRRAAGARRAHSRNARRPSAPPSSWMVCIGTMHRANRRPRSKSRASAMTPVTSRPAARRASSATRARIMVQRARPRGRGERGRARSGRSRHRRRAPGRRASSASERHRGRSSA